MKTLPESSEKNKPERPAEVKRQTAAAQASLARAVLAAAGPESSFAERERMMLELSNAMCREILREDLQKLADFRTEERLRIDGALYKKHQDGHAAYHSLCGSVRIKRATYRECGRHNGAIVVPLELEAGLIERATPALAYRVALGDAQAPGRQWEQQLHASFREPPSRSTLERMAKAIGSKAKQMSHEIEPIVRGKEQLPKGVCAIALGLDRTTVPMEELLDVDRPRDPCRTRRIKKYKRKRPAPIEVVYRMAYVGTITFTDKHSESLQTIRYAASATEGPNGVVAKLMADLNHAQQLRRNAGRRLLTIGVIQDGAPEMWALLETALYKEAMVPSWLCGIDRFHLTERVAEALAVIPIQKTERERRLLRWREELEEDDATIDRIERYLQRHGRNYFENWKKNGCRGTRDGFTVLIDHIRYIQNHKHKMRYATLRNAALPTGSGATEGACKSVIMIRAKRCGQRWHARGVDAVLTLRAYYMSERLPAFWNTFAKTYAADVTAFQ